MDNQNAQLPADYKVTTNLAAVMSLRDMLAEIVANDLDKYSDAYLGMPNSLYTAKMRQVSLKVFLCQS